MKRVSQKDKILAYMESGKRITTWIAYARFRCTRLPDRIRDIERDGRKVSRRWKKVGMSRVMEYYL